MDGIIVPREGQRKCSRKPHGSCSPATPTRRTPSRRSTTSASISTSRKPWENEDLKIVLRNGLEKRILLKRLEDKISEVNKAHGELMNPAEGHPEGLRVSRSKTPSILIVDDEDMVLSSLRGPVRSTDRLRRPRSQHPEDAAIAQLERRPIDVVISDFLMPEMNGIELLKEVKATPAGHGAPSAHRLRRQGERDQGDQRRRASTTTSRSHGTTTRLLNIVRNALAEKSLSASSDKDSRARYSPEPPRRASKSKHRFLGAGARDGGQGTAEPAAPTDFPTFAAFVSRTSTDPARRSAETSSTSSAERQ